MRLAKAWYLPISVTLGNLQVESNLALAKLCPMILPNITEHLNAFRRLQMTNMIGAFACDAGWGLGQLQPALRGRYNGAARAVCGRTRGCLQRHAMCRSAASGSAPVQRPALRLLLAHQLRWAGADLDFQWQRAPQSLGLRFPQIQARRPGRIQMADQSRMVGQSLRTGQRVLVRRRPGRNLHIIAGLNDP